MHAVAKQLQAQGRNGDSVLVHMTPNEVGGLQALAQAAGGSLTINPHTGLPEANWLESLLPTILGVAGMFIGIPPMVTAAVVGGITGIAKHDLGAGLMAGLGAYGGAGLGEALGAVGSAANTVTATLPAATSASLASAPGVTAAQQIAAQGVGGAGVGTAFQQAGARGLQAIVGAPMSAGLPASTLTLSATPGASAASNVMAGVEQLGTKAGWSELGKNLSYGQMAGLGGTLLGAMSDTGSGGTTAPAEVNKYPYKGPYMAAPRKAQYPTNRAPNDSSEFQYFDTVNPVPNVVPYQSTNTPDYNPDYTTGMATGGVGLKDGSFVVDARTVSELGNGSSGAGQDLLARFGGKAIKGPGDGVSDSIRANIGGRQEARVARDEVKFDPKAVQRLGKGDPRKGSDRLYALMAKAHDARQGAKRGQDTGLKGLLGGR